MLKNSHQLNTILRALPLAGLLMLQSCSGGQAAKNDQEVKEAMPEELKDTVVQKMDEESALEKLNNVIDTAAKK